MTLDLSSLKRSGRSRKLSLHCRMKVQSLWESEPLKGSGSLSLVLAGLLCLTSLPIASANFWASEAVSSGVLTSGSMCVELWCKVDIGDGVGGCVADRVVRVEIPDGSIRVKVSSNPACCEFHVVWGIKHVLVGQDVQIYCYE